MTALSLVLSCLALQSPEQKVSDRLTAAYELLAPAGQTILFPARPVDLALSPDGKLLWVKTGGGVRVMDVATWREVAAADSKGGASLTGLELTADGRFAAFSNSKEDIHVFELKDGKVALSRDIAVTKGGYPCGLRFSPDAKTLYACLSTKNVLAAIDFSSGKTAQSIPVGVAPYEVVVTPDGETAYVSCQGGRHVRSGDRKEGSAGTDVVVDERGVAASGTVSVVDLKAGKERTFISVGLLPGALCLIPRRNLLIVANSNHDSISIVDTALNRPVKTLSIRPSEGLPFGSMPNGLTASPDGKTLYVSLAGNNAVALVDISDAKTPVVKGFIPTAWYPGPLVERDGMLFIGNVKGFGSVAEKRPVAQGHNSWDVSGVVQKVPLPGTNELIEYSNKVMETARVKPILRSMERQAKPGKSSPVPTNLGDPSPIEHVIYIIKENRTYDQVFGDMERGDGDKKLCTFGEKITPNHHALAREFVLLDNYYCNGVCSADGHTWAVEGNVTPYLERQFGGFTRTYDYGTDPLTYSSSGMIWDPILAKGLSFRNFGCEVYPDLPKGWKVDKIWRNYEQGNTTTFPNRIELERLKDYTSADYPGWEMAIPDVLRMDRFLKEFKEWEAKGTMPNLVMVYLPQDHTAGTSPGYPTAGSYVADNDLALGRLVEAVSKSKFWKKALIVANEDDPQNGYDHVDGHRSICMVAGPYVKRGKTVSKFYNQSSVLHTILRIFGLSPMNQKIASAPLMTDCFVPVPDLRPYEVRDPQVDLNKVNPQLTELKGKALYWAQKSASLDFKSPDFPSLEKDNLMNRILWHAMKGYDTPYPVKYQGAHGRGLRGKGLKIDKADAVDDD